MIASIHAWDVGAVSVPGAVWRAPSASGLRYGVRTLTAPLGGARMAPPTIGRVGMIGFWDDDESVDRFAATSAGGWHVRLEPVQIHGYQGSSAPWPGLTMETRPDPGGPAVVLTLARTRLTQTARFVRASGWAASALAGAPGFIWGTAMARPPIVATCSLWESASALEAYAYGQAEGGHRRAMAADGAKPFHHEGVFIRFHPYRSEGSLGGRNALDGAWLERVS
jgi:hypothetical protein